LCVTELRLRAGVDQPVLTHCGGCADGSLTVITCDHWKIDKCMRLLEVSSVFEAGDEHELRRILDSLKERFAHRNRYMHSAWGRYDEKSGKAYATHTQRKGTKDVVACGVPEFGHLR
jgi:hypothetical protein